MSFVPLCRDGCIVVTDKDLLHQYLVESRKTFIDVCFPGFFEGADPHARIMLDIHYGRLHEALNVAMPLSYITATPARATFYAFQELTIPTHSFPGKRLELTVSPHVFSKFLRWHPEARGLESMLDDDNMRYLEHDDQYDCRGLGTKTESCTVIGIAPFDAISDATVSYTGLTYFDTFVEPGKNKTDDISYAYQKETFDQYKRWFVSLDKDLSAPDEFVIELCDHMCHHGIKPSHQFVNHAFMNMFGYSKFNALLIMLDSGELAPGPIHFLRAK